MCVYTLVILFLLRKATRGVYVSLSLSLSSSSPSYIYPPSNFLRSQRPSTPSTKAPSPPPRPAQRYPSVPPTISTTSQPSINVTNPIHTSTPPSHRSAPRPTSNGLCMYACMHACTYSPSHSPTDMLSLGERTNVVQGWHRPTLMRVCIWVRRFTVHTDTAFVGGER